MQWSASRLASLLSGRMARNIYFWLILTYTRLDFEYTLTQVCFTIILFALLAALFYTNNLRLIPRFLSTKAYGKYVRYYLLLCLAVALGYITTIKLMLAYFQGYHVGSVSPLVLGHETADLSIVAFLEELIPYFIVLFMVGCIFAMSWYVMDYQRQQRLIEEGAKQRLETELNFLKSQINPHFLFNTLNNLYSLTLKKSDTAPEVVSKMSAILRYLLYESDVKLASFEKEKEIMLAYIDLEMLRLKDRGNMEFLITADKEYSIPPLLWLPVLENVFKHGTSFINTAARKISYRFDITADVLTISSANTISKSTDLLPKMQEGIGLKNLEGRLKLLYENRHAVNIKQTNDEYRITVEVKLAGL
jgi:two-component system LytT family sensor kinase